MTEERRHPNDGKPYYCNHCGSGYGEFIACEDGPCELEPAGAAKARRQRWLDGIARQKAKNIKLQASPRATVPGLRVLIEDIPHNTQRYDTCGDWYYESTGYEFAEHQTLHIRVSTLQSRREMFLVAIHELVEAFLCECAGVTEAEVDKFDMDGLTPEGTEPGDQFEAPYYIQHQIATGVERILAAEVEVSWQEYSQHIKELSQ